ncbi:hypothetical protein GCM10009118_07440 [Wandonia haliotis]|uniref:RHS repeat-associated core domain-containing protein n=1 Tax=Wandonia haliotis TaxID=574963 RepID=A0ABN1MM38_9FLAO
MEKDDEIRGEGNSYDFGNRMYNPRIGSFLSLDKFESKFPNQSPYSFAANTPIWAIDNNGDSVWGYSETIPATGGVGMHLFMRVKTTDRDIIIELYGPENSNGKGGPQVNDYNPGAMNRDNVIYHQVFESISNDDDAFENKLIAYAEYIEAHNILDANNNVIDNTLLPKYDMFNNNSNGYVCALIEYAGGNLGDASGGFTMPSNPFGSVYQNTHLFGASWKDLQSIFEILCSEFGVDEYYNNTYGMSKQQFQ